MALLISIDTATATASVCITRNAETIMFCKNEFQKEHASFLHTAITGMLHQTGYSLTSFDAVAVTSGPGSYTGLRVGMSAAKGFCYALAKPLITINTLEVMTKAAIDDKGDSARDILFCPMIDARRMEVFLAIYDFGIKNVLSPAPIVLKEGIFDRYMISNKLLFFGSGSTKLKQMQLYDNSLFSDVKADARDLAKLADNAFNRNEFANISYAEPTYFKDFHSVL